MSDISGSLRAIMRGAGIMFVGTMISKAIMYVYRLLVARPEIGLGPDAYGQLSLALGVFWAANTISHLGLSAGVERYVTKYLGRDDTEGVRGTILSGFFITVPWSIVVAGSVFVAADWIAVTAFHSQELGLYIKIFAVGIPFQILFKNAAKLFMAFQRFEYFSLIDSIYRSFATLILTAILLFMGYGLFGAVLAQLAAIISAAFISLYLLETRVFSAFRSDVSPRMEPRKLLSYSWPVMFSAVIGLVVGWTDTFMLGFFETTENVGIYNAALPTAQLLIVFGNVFSNSLFPNVSELYGKGKKQEAIKIAQTTVKWMFSLSFPAVLLMIMFAGPILRLLFGSVYGRGALALSLLGAAYFIRVMTAHAGSFIKSEDRTKFLMANSLVVAVLNIVLNYLFIKVFQLSTAGAAMATATSLTLGALLATAEAYYIFRVQPYKLTKLAPPFVSAAVAASTVYLLIKIIVNIFFSATPFWILPPALILFGLMYGVLFLFLGGLEQEDIDILRAVERKSGKDLEPIKKVIRRIMR